MKLEIKLEGEDPKEVVLSRTGRGSTMWVDDRPHAATIRPVGRGFEIAVDDRVEHAWVVVEHDVIHVHAFGRSWRLEVIDPVAVALTGADATDVALAPMPGAVQEVLVAAGDEVGEGDVLLVIESMKMQSQIVAPRDGVVERVEFAVGDTFDRGAVLVSLHSETVAEEGDDAE